MRVPEGDLHCQCQFSQHARTNFMKTYLHWLILNCFFILAIHLHWIVHTNTCPSLPYAQLWKNPGKFKEHWTILWAWYLLTVEEQYKDLNLLLNITSAKTIGLAKFSCLLRNIWQQYPVFVHGSAFRKQHEKNLIWGIHEDP